MRKPTIDYCALLRDDNSYFHGFSVFIGRAKVTPKISQLLLPNRKQQVNLSCRFNSGESTPKIYEQNDSGSKKFQVISDSEIYSGLKVKGREKEMSSTSKKF